MAFWFPLQIQYWRTIKICEKNKKAWYCFFKYRLFLLMHLKWEIWCNHPLTNTQGSQVVRTLFLVTHFFTSPPILSSVHQTYTTQRSNSFLVEHRHINYGSPNFIISYKLTYNLMTDNWTQVYNSLFNWERMGFLESPSILPFRMVLSGK